MQQDNYRVSQITDHWKEESFRDFLKGAGGFMLSSGWLNEKAKPFLFLPAEVILHCVLV